jgi:hypothetical protein
LVNPPRTSTKFFVVLVFLGFLSFGVAVRLWKSSPTGTNRTIVAPGQEASKEASAGRAYSLPANFKLDVAAERGPEGQVFIVGSTNLPDETKLSIETSRGQESGSGDSAVFVMNGHFRSAGFTKGRQPYPAGNYTVRVFCLFNRTWQNRAVLAAVGEGGANLHGRLFKLKDPDVVDSEVMMDQRRRIIFPPITPAVLAIILVKTAVLTIPEKGRSGSDIQTNLDLFVRGGGFTPKAWTAVRTEANSYTVALECIDAGSQKQALWSVNLDTRTVKYINELAKLLSWTPNY